MRRNENMRSELDKFRDDFGYHNTMKAKRTSRTWKDPNTYRARVKGINDWANSFDGKAHYRKLARYNALHEAIVAAAWRVDVSIVLETYGSDTVVRAHNFEPITISSKYVLSLNNESYQASGINDVEDCLVELWKTK